MMVRRGVGFPGTGITGSQDEVKYWIDGQQTMNTQRVVRDTWSACATRDKGNKKKKTNQGSVLGLALDPKVALAMTDVITDALGEC